MRLTTVHKMGFAALIMAGSVFLSRLMGLLRDKVISWQFGAGSESDIYFAAFVVPDFLNHLLAGAYISITLIPLLSKQFVEDHEEGWRFFSAVFWWAALGIGLLTLMAFVLAPELARLVAPGFTASEQERLAHFLRIILPAQVFFLPGACVSALLYMRRQFWVPALTPLIYNGAIIVGGLLMPERGMEGFCWGVLAGAALGSFILPVCAASVSKTSPAASAESMPNGLSLRAVLWHPLLKRLLFLALPLMLGLSVVVLDEQFVRIFGSLAGEGAVSLLSYARRIMLVPVGVVAQAAGVASFPFLASLAAKQDTQGFDNTLNTALRGSLLVVLPLTGYMLAVAAPTLGFIFEGGRFSPEQTLAAAPLLQIFLLSVPFWVVQQVIGRAFYAYQNTLLPALIGTVATLVALPVYPVAVRTWGATGVALLTTACLFIYTLALTLAWKRQHGTAAFAGLSLLSLKTLALLTPATLGSLLLVQAFPHWLHTTLQGWGITWLEHAPAVEHALLLGCAGVLFLVLYVPLAYGLFPEALRIKQRNRT